LICNGENERQLKALAEDVAQDAKHDASVRVMGIEGEASSGGVLVDFGDLVVHLFSPEKRNYYRLEDIWDQARVVMHIQ
jgi:ribosome-associated protein